MPMSENQPEGQIEPVPSLAAGSRALTTPEFQGLTEMPAELEWFANINNPRTRKGSVANLRNKPVLNHQAAEAYLCRDVKERFDEAVLCPYFAGWCSEHLAFT